MYEPRAGSPISVWSARSPIWPAFISGLRGNGSKRLGSAVAVQKGGTDGDRSSHRAGVHAAKLVEDDSPAGPSHLFLCAASLLDADFWFPLPPLHTGFGVRGALLPRLPPPRHLRNDGAFRRVAGRDRDRA